MGILPDLQQKGYLMESLRIVDREGKKNASLNTAALRFLVGGRFLSIARSDIAATIYHACKEVQTRFATHITGIDQRADGVMVQLSDGSKEKFDLVIGADGLHSHIRSLVFGPDKQYERSLGAYVSAFTLPGYRPRDELTYVAYPAPNRQIARISLRDDKTLFLFTFRSELVGRKPENINEEKAVLRSAFADMGWEAPAILARLDEVTDFYFDHVSQIHMDRWSDGRIALIGDAAACASLLAGEGTGLAIAEAYVLAGELHRSKGDFAAAFRQYEERLRPFLIKKQQSALKMIAFFAPKNSFQVALGKLAIRASSIPFLANLLIGRTLRDDIDLPDYESPARR
jgi:2-polyprenyl-6-methoxyphenol hydroxylase-like FAD-dependent oxidoreductase